MKKILWLFLGFFAFHTYGMDGLNVYRQCLNNSNPQMTGVMPMSYQDCTSQWNPIIQPGIAGVGGGRAPALAPVQPMPFPQPINPIAPIQNPPLAAYSPVNPIGEVPNAPTYYNPIGYHQGGIPGASGPEINHMNRIPPTMNHPYAGTPTNSLPVYTGVMPQ